MISFRLSDKPFENTAAECILLTTDTVTLLKEIKYSKRNKIRMIKEEMCNVVSVIKHSKTYARPFSGQCVFSCKLSILLFYFILKSDLSSL